MGFCKTGFFFQPQRAAGGGVTGSHIFPPMIPPQQHPLPRSHWGILGAANPHPGPWVTGDFPSAVQNFCLGVREPRPPPRHRKLLRVVSAASLRKIKKKKRRFHDFVQRLCLFGGGDLLCFLPVWGQRGALGGGNAQPWGPVCTPQSAPSSLWSPEQNPQRFWGQKRCKAISPLLWVSSTGVTPEGHPERGLGRPTARLHRRDRVCSRGGCIAFWGEPGAGRPLRPVGVTSVVCVTDTVTLGPCLRVTAGFLRSSAASAAAGFRILPSVTEPEPHPRPCAAPAPQTSP